MNPTVAADVYSDADRQKIATRGASGGPKGDEAGLQCCKRRVSLPTLGMPPRRDPSRKIAVRWLKFNAVGGMGIVVQVVALFLLKSVLHFNYLAATALAVEAAVVHNFVWHEQFTWADRVRPSWHRSLPRLLRFNLTSGGVSIAGNLALMKVMVGFGQMNYLAANAIAIVLCSVANFLVSEEWVFEEDCSATE
jgi:putative flippase GtrA